MDGGSRNLSETVPPAPTRVRRRTTRSCLSDRLITTLRPPPALNGEVMRPVSLNTGRWVEQTPGSAGSRAAATNYASLIRRGCLVLEPVAQVRRLVSPALVSLTLRGLARPLGLCALLPRAALLNPSQPLDFGLVGQDTHLRFGSSLSVRKSPMAQAAFPLLHQTTNWHPAGISKPENGEPR